ncbi:MAG: lipoprotein-releasing ABC transporter permease subunit [Holosporaceae bacterium]|jgi:lipoprotein-releasing system permease protein|nr:lipoprotein-releasing ABC transporter permease subunit [Holosporaceae bacterium]
MLVAELLIAWRYIKSKRRERVVSAIAAFSLAGIALGVATLIIVTSVMNGFRKEFAERVIGFNGHLALHPTNEDVDYRDTVKDLLSIAGIRQAIPTIDRQAIVSNNRTVKGSLIQGISVDDIGAKKLISDNIVNGDLKNFDAEDAIVLGETLARHTRVSVGDNVIVVVPEMDETGFGAVPRKKTFRLTATFNSGMHEYDNSVSFIPLEIAKKLFKMPRSISTISVFVDDPLKISAIKEKILQKFSHNFRITDWQTSNSSFMKAIEVERNVMFLILTLIILVASFNIISCMIMLVKDKEKEIAILRTIGMARASILRIFFMVGASIGVVGTLSGIILGLLFSTNIQKIQNALDALLNTQVFSPEVYFLTHLPSILRPVDIVITGIVSLLLSCLATLYPAHRASKLNPTEILRYV